MTNLAEHSILTSETLFRPPPPVRVKQSTSSRPRCRDYRWRAVASALNGLRSAKRRSVRIVDVDCGSGTLLLCAARYARILGFISIEARGIGIEPGKVQRARCAALLLHDPAIEVTFENLSLVEALAGESDFPADILLWHGYPSCDADCARAIGKAVACAARTLIGDPAELPTKAS